MQGERRDALAVGAAPPAPAGAARAPVPARRQAVPGAIGEVGLQGQPHRLGAGARADLEDVAVAVVVVGDHVEHVQPLHAGV
jgi:hypothetical protein